MTQTKRITVVGAIVRDAAGRILIARRGPAEAYAGKWEFPGGKVEPGETLEAALAREIREELGASLRDVAFYACHEHAYPEKTVELHFFLCRSDDLGETVTSPVHDRCVWVKREELGDYDFLEADRDVVAKLRAIIL